MSVTISTTNKPLNPRAQDLSPKGYNRASLYSGKALDFDGVNDILTMPTALTSSLSTTSVTFVTNVKTDFATWAGTRDDAFSFAERGVILAFNNDSIYYYYRHQSASWRNLQVPNANFKPQEWNQMVTTIDLNADTWKAYINGIEVASSGTYSDTAIAYDSNALTIGAQSAARFFDGQIAGFKIFNTALTAAQVSDLYLNPEKIVPDGVANSALKLWLPMMEGAGTTCYNGASDALSSEQITAFTNGTIYPYDTFVSSGNDITSAIKTSGFGGAASNAISLTNGDKVLVTFDYTHNSGDPLRVLIAQNASGAGTAMSDIAYVSASGQFTYVFSVTSTQNGYLQLGTGGSTQSINASIENISFKILSNFGTISGATWTSGVGAPVAQTALVGWNKPTIGGNAVLIPQGLTASKDIFGNSVSRNAYALNLDGKSWAEVHDNASVDLSNANASFEAWLYYDGTPDQYLFNKFSTSAGFRIRIEASNNFGFFISDGTNSQSDLGIHSLSINAWNHLVLTTDGTNFKRYINGSLVDTDIAPTPLTTYANAEVLYIGCDQFNANNVDNQLALPRIYNRALTATEVARNYNADKSKFGL